MKKPNVRRGKGDSVLNAIQTRTSSCLVFDPKGELCTIIRKRSQQQGQAWVLNPFNIVLTKKQKSRRTFK
jgi:type IV secretory pathway TraG/TraD family ATPase VirD4